MDPNPPVRKWESAAATGAKCRPPAAEYLTGDEVERLMAAARSRPGRYGQRDATMILLAYRHGLRVSELVGLRWDMLDLAQGISMSSG